MVAFPVIEKEFVMARKPSVHVEHTANEVTKTNRDDLASLIRDTLNKAHKDGGKVAHFLDEQEDPSMISDWISTGSTLLDLSISNRPNGGLPVGRIVELNGLESTGKSLICAHLCAETQKKGGVAIYLDTESAAAPDFWKALGVKLENLVYVRPFTVEEVFEYVEGIIAKVRASNKDRLVTIIVDSIAGATTEKEAESNHGVEGYNTAKALIIGKAMRRITDVIGKQRILLVLTNQLRVNMNAMAFGDKYITPGGKGIPFAASVRVRLASMGKLKKGDDVIGVKCKATVVKNRMGPPYKTAEFEIFFDSGIQDRKSWLEFLKKHDMAKSGGGKYTIKLESGEYKLTAAEFADKLNTEKSFKDEIYNTICEKQIMIYRDPTAKIDEDVTESEDDEEVGSEE